MKIHINSCLLACLFLWVVSAKGQEKPQIINSGEILKKGYEYFTDSKYDEAITEYIKIPENDTNYYVSIVEQVYTYYKAEKFEDGVSAALKGLKLKRDLNYELYLNLGTCLDMLKRYDEAIKYYDEAIKIFPTNNLLYYNKAISLHLSGKYLDSFNCFKKAAQLNPFHPNTHFRLGVLAMDEGNTSMAMLAFNTYLILSPGGDNSNYVLVKLNDLASMKYKEKTEPKSIDVKDGDDFSEVDLLIENYVGLDAKYKVPSKIDIPFVKQSHLLFSKLPESPSHKGFWYNTYVPFYKKLLKDKKFEVYSIYLLQASENEKHKKLIDGSKDKIIGFIDWIKPNWDDCNRYCEMNFNGTKQRVALSRANKGFAVNAIGNYSEAKDKFTGYVELYYPSGKIKGKGNYNDNGVREGEWFWYHENSNLHSKELYKNGLITGIAESYSDLGIIESKIPYENEKITGLVDVYENTGALYKKIYYKENMPEGNYEEYYPNGQISFKSTYKAGLLNGKGTSYYITGELRREINITNGKLNGEEKYYFRNGKTYRKSTYVNDMLNGIRISYYSNGHVRDSSNYKNDKVIGKSLEYYRNGVVKNEQIYDENGKINGVSREFDTDGKLLNEFTYLKGQIVEYKYFNEKGDILKQDKRKLSGTFYHEGYYFNNNIRNKGMYGSDMKSGVWEYYDVNGLLETKENFKEGKVDGESTYYFNNGKIKKTINFKEDNKEGYYVRYYSNSNIEEHGNYKEDKLEGQWIEYYPNKVVKSDKYFLNGVSHGLHKFYSVTGKLTETIDYYKGVIVKQCNFDTLGNKVDSLDFVNSSCKLVYHFFKGGPIKDSYNILFNNFNGEFESFYPNGNILLKGKYIDGEKHGKFEWFFFNGVKRITGEYIMGEPEGTWEYFNEDGKLYKVYNYHEGELNGKNTFYYENGNVETERDYVDGMIEGVATYYNHDNQIDHKRYYKHDQFIAYSYFDASGQEKKIDLKNETAEVKVYNKNGKIARSFKMINGVYEGEYLKYYSNGQLFSKDIYLNDELNGESVEYYSNGVMKEKVNYSYGMNNGKAEYFHPNGKLKDSSYYIFDEQNGPRSLYDVNGKLTTVLNYYNDQIFSIIKK